MITIDKDMTIYTAAELKEELFGQFDNLPAVDLDLSNVGEMDTAGLQILLASKKMLEENGKTFNISDKSTAVEEVFAIYGLGNYFKQ